MKSKNQLWFAFKWSLKTFHTAVCENKFHETYQLNEYSEIKAGCYRAMRIYVRFGNATQGISYITNSKGKKIALRLDLTNPAVQEMVEDLIDTLDVIERRSESTRPFEEVKNEILLNRS